MKLNKIDFLVYKAAFIAKLKKWFLGKKDPYLPLPKKLYLSPSDGISSAYKTAERHLSFLKSKETPRKWQKLARKKLMEISGYDINRQMPKIVKIEKEKLLQDNIFKRTLYLGVREKTDLPVHLIYLYKCKRNILDIS